jgi:uncharacterized protein (TIGR03545 family)
MSEPTNAAPAVPAKPPRVPKKQGLVRWKALLPLAVLLGLMVLVFVLYVDRAVKRGVEATGTQIVGAKVELREADLAIGDGSIALRGLAVTNPGSPMTNLFEADEIQVDLRVLPLLEKKVLLDTVAVRGLRFNTPRATSGAIEKPSETSSAVRDLVSEWKAQVKVPAFSLSTLTQTVNVAGISAESLATLREARHAVAYVDTARAKLVADLNALDPRPTIDSAEALVNRLRGASLRTLGLGGVRTAVNDTRRTIDALGKLDDRLKAFETETKANAGGLTQRLAAIPAARQQDYAYARSLLKLPTLDIPSLGPQLFGDVIATQVGELLYWVQMVEKYIPPGIERQLKPGPKRMRASGADVLFAKNATYPDFLMRLAELSLAIGGEGAAAGDYTARIVGVTTQPAVYGAPTRFAITRSAGRAGPREVSVGGMLDHRAAVVRDSVSAALRGIKLPTMQLAGLGATLALGDGFSDLRFERTGAALDGRWLWRATGVRWTRDSTAARAASPAMRLVEDAVWRAISRIDSVEIEARFSGEVSKPQLGIRTNVATALSNALRDQLGEEVRRAEAQVRAKVDELVETKIAEARAQADVVKREVETRVAAERARLDEQKKALETKLRDLVRIPGIG